MLTLYYMLHRTKANNRWVDCQHMVGGRFDVTKKKKKKGIIKVDIDIVVILCCVLINVVSEVCVDCKVDH